MIYVCNYCGCEFENKAMEPSCPDCKCKDCEAEPLNRNSDLSSCNEYNTNDLWDI